MNRTLLPSTRFLRDVKRLRKKNRDVDGQIEERLALLAADPAHPKLKSHKLKGKLADR